MRKKSKSVSFDAMIKFFMQNYGIPTRTDIDKLMDRLDRLEGLIARSMATGKGRRSGSGKKLPVHAATGKSSTSAASRILEIISGFDQGVGFREIQDETGFDEKKIRNILYRLHKLKKIKRIGRGIYRIA